MIEPGHPAWDDVHGLLGYNSAMADDHKELISEEIKQTLNKLNLKDVDLLRPLTPEDILYLLNHYPFLQIVRIGGSVPLPDVELITAKTNWVIQHYGDAMSSSLGRFLFRGGNFRLLLKDEERDGRDDGDIINPGKGTICKQAFDTAQEMMALAKKLGWAGVKIVDGHPMMQWAAWMYAQDEDMNLEGYQPDKKARDKRDRIKRSGLEDMAQLEIRPSRT
jgi:hypothetical protein